MIYMFSRFFNFAKMNYPLFLAKRLSLSSGKGKKSPAVVVAIISIALSTAVMIASIAIVTGFKKEITEKVAGFNGHISIYRIPVSEDDDNIIYLTPEIEEVLHDETYVTDYSIQVSIPAILKTDEDFKGIYLKALNGSQLKRFLEKNLEAGALPDFSQEESKNKIIISRAAARQLNLTTGDKIDTYFISDDVRLRRLEIAGIFNTHFDQYDNLLAYGSYPLIAQMGSIEDGGGTSLQIETDNIKNSEQYASRLQAMLNQGALNGETTNYYRTDTVINQGRGYFSWLSLLDTNVAVIITLMIIIGGVTLISGMLILILERKKFIGSLRALGANASAIRKVFIYMAVKIAIIGLLIGDSVIVILLILQQRYHLLQLDAESYYIDFVPVSLSGWDILMVNLGVIIIAYLILVFPSRFVGKISPAESMERE